MKNKFAKPNQITYIRILLIPVFALFFFIDIPYRDYIAGFIFAMLAMSDMLDGYLARKKNQVTELGKILDPIADKLLVLTALILLVDRIPLWMTLVIIVREILVTAMRLFFLPEGVVIGASKLGKAKTFSQMTAILAVIWSIPYNVEIMIISVIITIISGIDYLSDFRKFRKGYSLEIPEPTTAK